MKLNALKALIFVMILIIATGCAAAFSGYDQSKYASSNSGDASSPSSMTTPVDPQTEPLPRMKATKMLDPRSPLGDAASEAR